MQDLRYKNATRDEQWYHLKRGKDGIPTTPNDSWFETGGKAPCPFITKAGYSRLVGNA